MKFKLKEIKPNPFRNIENYPIHKEKVEALRESIGQTGFWDNVVARQKNGHAEIAYGHHRLAALREEYRKDPSRAIELIVRPLTDESMIKIMARENMEEWGSNAQIEMETVKAVVRAFAEGKIKLSAVKIRGRGAGPINVRCAPSFHKQASRPSSHDDEGHYYNAQTVAEFIGWINTDGTAQTKVKTALNALELIEIEAAVESDFVGIGTRQAEALVSQTNTTLKHREKSRSLAPTAIAKAREVSHQIAKTFREAKEPVESRKAAQKVREKIDRRPKQSDEVHDFIRKINKELFDVLSPRDELTAMILEVLKVISDVDKDVRADLEASLRCLSGRATAIADMVRSGKSVPKQEAHKLLRDA